MVKEMTLTLNSPITEEQWDAITDVDFEHTNEITFYTKHGKEVKFVKASAQPEQRYTKEELRVFQHGISLSLLSKRSAQHWRYDEDTATEIEFLERLYEKVVADMRGEQDE